MTKIFEVDGIEYHVPDNATLEDVESLAQASKPPSTAKDVGKSVVSGIGSGVAGLIGLPETAARGMRWTAEQAGRLFGSPVDQDYIEGKNQVKGPTAEGTQRAMESVTGEFYKPRTRGGRYARTIGEFVPGALAGPGGAARSIARFGLIPGAASEAAGEATHGTKFEPYARAAAGLLGGLGGSMVLRGNAGERAVGNALRGVTEQQIDDAGRLMMEARVRGVDLTWPEAIDQVTGGASTLGNIMRVVENSERGGSVMQPFYSGRPQQVEQAFNRQMGDVAAVPMTPSAIGPRASEAAEGIFENVRRSINRRTEPHYQAARADLVPDRTLARMHRSVPGFSEALQTVRNNPHLNREIANLPDNSVAVLNEVKKQLDTAGANAAQVTNPQRNMQIASSNERSAAAVRRAGRRASAPYRRALDEQEALRGRELQPLREGQIGRIATAGDTKAAGQALLPDTPLPNTAAETGRTTRAMAGQDLRTTQNLVRSRLEGMYQTAARDLQGGANQFAGAAARKRIYGDRQLQANIRAALTELPNGSRIAQGFDTLMDIFQATGRRQPRNSATEFNRMITTELSGGRALGEAMSGAAGRFNPLSAVRDRYQQWMLGRNLDGLARLLTNPNAQRRLVDLSAMRRGDPRLQLLASQIAEELIPQIASDVGLQ